MSDYLVLTAAIWVYPIWLRTRLSARGSKQKSSSGEGESLNVQRAVATPEPPRMPPPH